MNPKNDDNSFLDNSIAPMNPEDIPLENPPQAPELDEENNEDFRNQSREILRSHNPFSN